MTRGSNFKHLPLKRTAQPLRRAVCILELCVPRTFDRHHYLTRAVAVAQCSTECQARSSVGRPASTENRASVSIVVSRRVTSFTARSDVVSRFGVNSTTP